MENKSLKISQQKNERERETHHNESASRKITGKKIDKKTTKGMNRQELEPQQSKSVRNQIIITFYYRDIILAIEFICTM